MLLIRFLCVSIVTINVGNAIFGFRTEAGALTYQIAQSTYQRIPRTTAYAASNYTTRLDTSLWGILYWHKMNGYDQVFSASSPILQGDADKTM